MNSRCWARPALAAHAAAALMLFVSMASGQEVSEVFFGEQAALAVTLHPGALLRVWLPAQPAAGFGWQLVSADQEVIAILESRFDSPSGGAPRVGAPADHLFVLKALKVGQTEAVFAYGRPWEKNEPPKRTTTLNIKVQL